MPAVSRIARDPQGLGAFETPADVAAHLAGNTILPLLLAPLEGDLRQALRGDPARYLRPEQKHGLHLGLPDGDPARPADPALALPGETWAGTAARRRRCAGLLDLLAGPAELGIGDLVLANLDLGRLALDVLEGLPLEPALAFGRALAGLTVLDPTCGSGACLAAAAEVLEPLHTACRARLAQLGCPAPPAGPGGGAGLGRGWILRHTLHGVDIRPEAVERCRARLGAEAANLRVGDALLEGPGAFPWREAFPGAPAFDVILGNPPFGAIPRDADRPALRAAYRSARPRWSADESLATLAVERCLQLLKPGGHLGLVLPLAAACSTDPGFEAVRRLISVEPGLWLWSHFDRTPNALFGRGVRTRCTLALCVRPPGARAHQSATTGLVRWSARARGHLFATLHYARLELDIGPGIPKVSSQAQADALRGLVAAGPPLGADLEPARAGAAVFVGGSAYNWFPAWRELPASFDRRGRNARPARLARFACASEEEADTVFALLCSSLGYWWWAVASDGFNLKRWLVLRFPLSLARIPGPARAALARLGRELRLELGSHPVHKDNRGRIGNFLLPACAAQTLAIDRCLGESVPGLSAAFMDELRMSKIV